MLSTENHLSLFVTSANTKKSHFILVLQNVGSIVMTSCKLSWRIFTCTYFTLLP
jgi:hypothetical protein